MFLFSALRLSGYRRHRRGSREARRQVPGLQLVYGAGFRVLGFDLGLRVEGVGCRVTQNVAAAWNPRSSKRVWGGGGGGFGGLIRL